jgi:hypothetical protein
MNKKSEAKIKKAMQHPDVLGAGAAKRKELSPKEDVAAVMKEWKKGTLRSGGGEHVATKEQALAIAISESKKRKTFGRKHKV